MERQIEADSPLDYIDFCILTPNNYDIYVCRGEVEEKVGCSPTEKILAYLSPNGLSEQSQDNIRLQLPRDLEDNTWFTKATLMRLLKMIDSPDVLNKMVALNDEISQLEETRGFHLSLYDQAGKRVPSSDDSKNELLRAMNLRLTALREELTTTFNQTSGEACSHKEIEGLKKFSEHFGRSSLRNTFCKLLESSQNSKVGDSLDSKKHPVMSQTRSNSVNKTTGDMKISLPPNLDQPVIYGASPAKAAQVERKNSTDSEESFTSSEDESQPTVERSRSLARPATPRRSASPMRRVQIGRSGPRRTPAVAIKSLSYFPGRISSRDTGDDEDGEEDGSEQASKVAQSNVRRMSVQDAISLFEKKQRDQTTDVQPKKSQDDKPVKPVLRRWSSGMGESSAQILDQSTPENKVEASSNRSMDEAETSNDAPEIQQERGTSPTNLCEPTEAVQNGGKLDSGDVGSLSRHHLEVAGSQEEGNSEKLDPAEWSKQKEEELNQMLVKFALCKPTSKYQKLESGDGKKPGSQKGKSGVISSKDQRSQRVQGENTEKKTTKQAVKKTDRQGPTRTVRKSFDKTSKNVTSSANVTDVVKKQAMGRAQKEKVVKRSPLASNTKRDLPLKAPTKPSLPATRKSWPSAPSPVASRTVATRTPPSITSSNLASSRQKGQLSAPASRSAPKVGAPQLQRKEVIKSKIENKRTPKTVDENKTQIAPKVTRTTKAKVISVSDENTPKTPVKSGVRKSMVTKKSSVVPLESKASNNTPRKSSTASPLKSPIPKRSGSPSVKESPSKLETPQKDRVPKCDTLVQDQDNDVVFPRASEPTNQTVDEPQTSEICQVDLEPEPHLQVESLQHCGHEDEISNEIPIECNKNNERIIESSEAEIQHEEEPIISPTAWVENGKQDIPSSEIAPELASSTNQADVGGSRVRHSLSQMLLEESSESDIIEWGNAENPPSMVFHKDAPKGLKRLLKFARKSKGEANAAGWLDTSEGEDDGDECKGLGRKNSDNLLKKAALNATHHGQYGLSSDGCDKGLADSEPLSARSNASNSSFQSSSSATSKASRSFFSLSAFRGNKTTDTKLR